MQGERYRTVPDQLRKYCLGYYGQPPAPIAPELMERAVRPGDRFVEGRCGDLVPPALERVRRARGPFGSDEDLLNAVFYGDEIVRPMFAARDAAGEAPHYHAFGALRELLDQVVRHGRFGTMALRGRDDAEDVRIELAR
jgi:oxaloacetate decarboxylase alpha subunit